MAYQPLMDQSQRLQTTVPGIDVALLEAIAAL